TVGRSPVALIGVFRLRLQKLLHFGVSQHFYRQDRTFVHTRTIGFADRLPHCRFLSMKMPGGQGIGGLSRTRSAKTWPCSDQHREPAVMCMRVRWSDVRLFRELR